MPSRAPRALTSARPCRKCKNTREPSEFPLWADKRAVMRGWVVRFWCSSCLVAGGHISAQRAEQYRNRAEYVEARVQAQVDTPQARVARHKATVSLVNRAHADPVFAAALLAAAEQVRLAQSQPLSA